MPMHVIEAILFEPVGCLAEFPSEPFNQIAARVSGERQSTAASGSRGYWQLLALMERRTLSIGAAEHAAVEAYENEAVEGASAYEDVIPALAELKALGVRLIVASSLSSIAVTRFLDRFALAGFFTDVVSRDTAGGVKSAPLLKAVANAAVEPERVMFITDTADGLQTARQAGVNPILMMNDPDEAMKLTAHNPAGGIVSLHELPDFVRLVSAEHARLPDVRHT